MERIVKGIWIPLEIWQDRSLSWNEKILLMEIDSFTARGRECYISNEYIADLLGVTERCASKYMSHLIEVGFIKMVRFDGRRRFVESTISFQADLNDCSRQGGTSVPHTYKEITDNIRERDNRGANHFVKPSVQEVAEYCRERNNGIDPEEFVAFYESKGWMVGKNRMKDWHAAIITWEKSKKRESPSRKTRPGKKESVLEHNLKVMDNMFGTNLHESMYGKDEQ